MPARKKDRSSAQARTTALAALLHELSLHDDASELRQFVELCRSSLRVRVWLFTRFAQEPETQQKFRAFLKDPVSAPPGIWSPMLQAEVTSVPPRKAATNGRHGGLSAAAIWALIRQYQTKGVDVMTFLLVPVWRQMAAEKRRVPPALWRATLDHWAAIVGDGNGELARELMRAVAFFDERPSGLPNRSAIESVDSWRIHVLLHILDHPQPSYRVGELFAHLPKQFRRLRSNGNPFVALREIRKFCELHGIRRDQRAGVRSRPPR